MEWIDGWSVREVLGGGAEGEEADPELDESEPVDPIKAARRKQAEEALDTLGVTIGDLMKMIGNVLATMHLSQIVHGDLTTSNMMLRPLPRQSSTGDLATPPCEIALIDFGLSSHSNVPENLAVDLYVLERAFASTHPTSEVWFQGVSGPVSFPRQVSRLTSTAVQILDAYAARMGEKKWTPIQARLDEGECDGFRTCMLVTLTGLFVTFETSATERSKERHDRLECSSHRPPGTWFHRLETFIFFSEYDIWFLCYSIVVSKPPTALNDITQKTTVTPCPHDPDHCILDKRRIPLTTRLLTHSA